MLIKIPGVAFNALRDIGIANPKLWKEIEQTTSILPRHKGFTAYMDLSPKSWRKLRECMLAIVHRLDAMTCQERGMEGSVEMQSLLIAIGRIDERLEQSAELARRLREGFGV